MFKISRPIFAHSLNNPPAQNLSTNIDLALLNSRGRISLVKQQFASETQFLLTVSNSQDIGLTSSDLSGIDCAVRDLLLAANLALLRAALCTSQISFKGSKLEFDEQPGEAEIEKAPDGSVHVHVREVVHLVDEVELEIRFSETLDEEEIFGNLAPIVSLDRHQLRPADSIRKVNLAKSLEDFEKAMSSADRTAIFKSLFNAVELATNFDGKSRRGSALDQEAACIGAVSSKSVREWRRLYNRMKHIDESEAQVKRYVRGTKKLPTLIPDLRKACAKAILCRLTEV